MKKLRNTVCEQQYGVSLLETLIALSVLSFVLAASTSVNRNLLVLLKKLENASGLQSRARSLSAARPLTTEPDSLPCASTPVFDTNFLLLECVAESETSSEEGSLFYLQR